MTKLNSQIVKEIVDVQGSLDISLRNIVYTIHLAFCPILSHAVI